MKTASLLSVFYFALELQQLIDYLTAMKLDTNYVANRLIILSNLKK